MMNDRKDLIIGCASNYSWDQMKYWVNSIQKSGFTGDIAIVGTNITKDTIHKLSEKGVLLSLYGNQQEDGSIKSHSNGAPHVERFFYIYNYLNTVSEKYINVITTDVRDVIFQTDPSAWLELNLFSHFLVSSEEGIRYKDEPWGNQNLLDTFGPFFHNILKEAPIKNVGVLAGDLDYVRSLLLLLFQLSINRPIPIVDQAVYNFITTLNPFNHDTLITNNSDGWAVQLGTTKEAVRAGNGDLGQVYKNKMGEYEKLYYDDQPLFTTEGEVMNMNNDKFCIVHQWDRVPFLKTLIENKYGE